MINDILYETYEKIINRTINTLSQEKISHWTPSWQYYKRWCGAPITSVHFFSTVRVLIAAAHAVAAAKEGFVTPSRAELRPCFARGFRSTGSKTGLAGAASCGGVGRWLLFVAAYCLEPLR